MPKTVREILLSEMEKRKSRNTLYSMRAFARDLGVGLGTLSEVMSGKRKLSKSNLMKVLQSLDLTAEQKKALSGVVPKRERTAEEEHQLLLEDQFKLISDWYYLGILNLAKIKNNKADSHWIADRLGLENYQVLEALQRLQRLGLLKIEKKHLVRTSKPLTTSRDLPSTAIRKHHQQNLELAAKSLNEVDVSLREFGSVTMPVNLKNIPKVKELLLKTRKKAADLLDQGATSEVYTLSFQLFPLSQVKQKK